MIPRGTYENQRFTLDILVIPCAYTSHVGSEPGVGGEKGGAPHASLTRERWMRCELATFFFVHCVKIFRDLLCFLLFGSSRCWK